NGGKEDVAGDAVSGSAVVRAPGRTGNVRRAGELALRRPDLLDLRVVERREHVELVAREVTPAERAAVALRLPAPGLGVTVVRVRLRADEVLAQDEVDDARDRIRAVDRRGAVGEHL